jgi:hypothetical protein
MKIFGTAFSLTLGIWRLRFQLDLDDLADEMGAPPVTSRYSCSDSPKQRISTHRP